MVNKEAQRQLKVQEGVTEFQNFKGVLILSCPSSNLVRRAQVPKQGNGGPKITCIR